MANDIQTGSIFWNLSVKTEDAKEKIDKLSGSVSNLNKLFGLFKVSVFIRGLKQIGTTISNIAMKQAEYIQVQNLFNKTMGDSIDKAKEFRDAMESKLGMDPQDIMSSMNAFQRLAETFGISNDRAYIMSKNLTQLAADMTAYGYSFENAMKKLKSGLAGEIEPMRAIGVALDKATVQQTLYSLGIDRTYDSLTRAQKTELLYYQIMTQTSRMQGELGRTLISPSNAVRIMKQEFTQLARAVGSIFIPIMMKIIPVVRAVTQVLTSAAKALAKLFGFEIGDYVSDYATDLEDVSYGLEDIEDNATGAGKALKKMLMPFDELNNVNFDTGSSGAGGLGAGVGGQLLDNLPEYNIFDSIVGNMDEQVEKIKAKINELIPIFKTVAIAGAGIFTIIKIVEYVEWIKKLKDSFTSLGIAGTALQNVLGGIMIVAGGFLFFDGLDKILDKDKNSVLGLAEAIGGLAIAVTGVYLVFGGIPALITGIVGIVVIAIAEIIRHWDEIKNTLKTFFTETLPGWFEKVGNWLSKIPEKIGYALGFITTKIVKFIFIDIPNFFKNLPKFFEDLVWGIIKFFYDGILEFGKIGENIVKGLQDGVAKAWNNFIQSIKNFFKGFIEGTKDVLGIHSPSKIFSDIGKNIIEGLIQGIQDMFNKLMEVFIKIKDDITSKVSEIWDNMKNGALEAWEGIKNVFSKVGTFFKDTFTNAWTAVKNVFTSGGQVFEGIKEGIFETFKNIVNNLIRGINTIISIPFKGIKKALDGIRGVEIFDLKPFSFIPTINIPTIPYLAKGGFVDNGQLFIANEAGPELIGNIGNRTAVANSQQITEGIENATYNAMTRALTESNGNNNPYFNVYVGNDKVYSGLANYQSNESNRYGVRV